MSFGVFVDYKIIPRSTFAGNLVIIHRVVSSENDAKQNENPNGHDLTIGSIPRLLLIFSLPLLIGNSIQAGYSIVNRIWVGQFLGASSLAAITITMQVSFILIAIANGMTLGSSILVSQYAGAKNWDGVRRIVQNSIPLVIGLSLVFMVAGEFLTVPLLHAVQTPPESFALAVSYMRLFLLSFPLIFTAILITFLLRGVGDSMTPLIFQAIGVGITAILDPLLMLGWLGFPKLGLNGTAYAMLIAQTLTVAALLIYLNRKNHIIAPDWSKLRIDWLTSRLTLKIALPSAAQQLLVSIGQLYILIFINRFGDNATAGFGAASVVDMVAFFLAMSFSMSISMLAGQNIGAQRHDRVRETFWWGMFLSGGMVLVISLAAWLFPAWIMHLFIRANDNPEAFNVGVGYLRIVGPSYICFAIMFVGIGVVNGAGHTFVTALITLLGLWCVRIPLAAYFSHRMNNVEGIWYALVISFVVSTILSMAYYASGHWKKAIIKHQPVPQVMVDG